MDALIPYLGKLLVYSGIFAGYYWLFMRKESFVRWNRWYIIAAMVLSVVLPLVELTVTTYYQAIPIAEDVLGEVFPYVVDDTISYTMLICYAVMLLYALVLLVLTMAGIKGILKINRLKKFNIYHYLKPAKLYHCRQKIAPFSFFKDVFMPDTIPLDSSEGQQILLHELEHVRARHSADKVLAQLLCTVFWFNPFFWLFRKEQSMVHEFLADRACVKSGGAKELSKLILCTLYPMQHAYFGNQFFQSPIKRRLAMIAKNKTEHSGWRKLVILPIAFACLCILAINVESKPLPAPQPQPIQVDEPAPQPEPTPQPPQSTPNEDGSYTYEEVQVKPLFNGANANTFSRWVAERIVYSKEAQDKKIQGRVILQFTIGNDGKLTNLKVLRGVDPLLDNEAMRVVSSSPVWTPGQQNGKNVAVIYTFPVNFTLADDNDDKSRTTNDNTYTLTFSADSTTIEIRGETYHGTVTATQDNAAILPNADGSYAYETVQVKPLFEGTDANAFSKWVAQRIVYPVEAQTKGIQGRVILQFKIDNDGKLSNVKVLRGVDPLLDGEAVRVVSSAPAWTAGQHNGKNVPVIYTFPVNFTLAEDDTKEKKDAIITINSDDSGKVTMRTTEKTNIAEDRVYQLSEVDHKPRFEGVFGNSQFYQWILRNIVVNSKGKATDKATVHFIIDKDGDVKNVKLAKSSGNNELDQALLSVVKRSPKWQPAAYKDRKVDVVTSISVDYKKNSRVVKLSFS